MPPVSDINKGGERPRNEVDWDDDEDRVKVKSVTCVYQLIIKTLQQQH